MKVALNRAQIKRGASTGYAITAGQESKLPYPLGMLCPTWPMVKGYKDGTLGIPEYLARYHQRLNRLDNKALAALYELGDMTLACYCRDTLFCHTYYAIKWLVDWTDSVGTKFAGWDKGFQAHPDIALFVDGLDWEGRCWEYRDHVNLDLLVTAQFQSYSSETAGER